MPYLIAFIIVIVAGVGFALFKSDQTTTDTAPIVTQEATDTPEPMEPGTETETATLPETSPETSVVAPQLTDAANPDTIPDGTHTTSVTYFTPKRDEYRLDVSLTTQDGIVTDANVIYSQGAENDPNPKRFEGAYKEVVIGTPLTDLDLSRVGGASLTTDAFNEAVDNILAESA